MLNLSKNSITHRINKGQFHSFNKVSLSAANKMMIRWLIVLFLIVFVILLLPWRQNVRAKGEVTMLDPGQRPQTIHATIAGRIEKWYVQEGELVNAGDTIAFLSEIKSDYFDPDIVNRTAQQVQAKEGSILAYNQKAAALADQIDAMKAELTLKRPQLFNKITQDSLKIISDSIDLIRARIDLDIAKKQYERTAVLEEKGIKSRTELENKNLKVQATKAKVVATENKLNSNRNQIANTRLQLQNLDNEYYQKISKAASDRFTALSSRFDAEASTAKMRIQQTNYERRNQFYYIIAPQDAYITKALKPGIGETIKEGDAIVSILPTNYQLAVELYVKPMDFPLIQVGQEVRFLFDGWPAIVFSGWPGISFGTFTGEVVAIDNMTSKGHKYRLLIAEMPKSDKPWPKLLRPGSGAEGIALLQQVPVWYEIWRQLNGFPPDFYQNDFQDPKLKAPIKSLK